MLRFLLILALSIYVLSKLGNFLFKARSAPQPQQRRQPDGKINVDSDPRKGHKGNFKGGDYVDYEEIK